MIIKQNKLSVTFITLVKIFGTNESTDQVVHSGWYSIDLNALPMPHDAINAAQMINETYATTDIDDVFLVFIVRINWGKAYEQTQPKITQPKTIAPIASIESIIF